MEWSCCKLLCQTAACSRSYQDKTVFFFVYWSCIDSNAGWIDAHQTRIIRTLHLKSMMSREIIEQQRFLTNLTHASPVWIYSGRFFFRQTRETCDINLFLCPVNEGGTPWVSILLLFTAAYQLESCISLFLRKFIAKICFLFTLL